MAGRSSAASACDFRPDRRAWWAKTLAARAAEAGALGAGAVRGRRQDALASDLISRWIEEVSAAQALYSAGRHFEARRFSLAADATAERIEDWQERFCGNVLR